MSKTTILTSLVVSLSLWTLHPVIEPAEEEWTTPPVHTGSTSPVTSFETEETSAALNLFVRLVGSDRQIVVELWYHETGGGTERMNAKVYSGLSHNQKRFGLFFSGTGGNTSMSNTIGTGDIGTRYFKINADQTAINLALGTLSDEGEFVQEASWSKLFSSVSSHAQPQVVRYYGYKIYRPGRHSSYPAYQGEIARVTIPDLTLPTLDWSNNGRTNSYSLAVPYDIAADPATAPLKITISDPSTELLHDLTHNPLYTSLGKWQHKDTTNSHEWNFDPTTGIWLNTATGNQWQFSDLDPGGWSDSLDGTTWVYDENTIAWTQAIEETS